MPPISPGVAAAGLEMLGQVVAGVAQGTTNRAQRRYNERMYFQQRQDMYQDWDKQNAYNHPKAQMQRLKEAGLNPALMYENGTGSLQATPMKQPGVESWKPEAPRVSGGAIAGAYFNTQNQVAQLDLVKTQMEVLQEEKDLKQAQTLNTLAQAGHEGVKRDRTSFDLELDKELRETSLQARQRLLDKLNADIEGREVDTASTRQSMDLAQQRNAREILQTSSNLREAAERILKSQLEREIETRKLPYTLRELEAKIQHTLSGAHIQAFEIELRKSNRSMSDPWFTRYFMRLLDNLKNKIID